MLLQLDDENCQVGFGESLGRALGGHGRVHLAGELGAGKTTLTRGLLRAHGYMGTVKSPTYTLVEPYELDDARIYHFDLYRLGDPEELEFIGGRDLLSEDALCVIEWPERGESWLPPSDLSIELAIAGNGRHALVLANSEHGHRALARLLADPTLDAMIVDRRESDQRGIRA
ncbi:tRNA (adenosine(37)-N6)-threonylcarbamoyltransferase complex ATPase subunit type 1 TsaE [Halomonas sp. TRM85114]|uniref:tRNA (adenosine(37)-N6)-threonylcarbamoyltransferase complex ATPase subunit type 1 TsaE n=1 Tax=Halomonas jincaotanensis TaxID=2810616 RepID=UPI001BD6034E|nr:tRNA (adenosine(37)-N6)-threonylcarbamoyltransferase complex ATPase subunit type 1 TsaE [Halomonas jincaotanensis]MBS9404325.1 tRNA (adenosine(37)-N6)-threonylcarbamoyltransferase complex ATPase subunit type 1 TsaE [Halomonas jincaotanensis]